MWPETKVGSGMSEVTETATKIVVELEVEINPETLADVFTDGCEGSIGYWAQFRSYHWMKADVEDPDSMSVSEMQDVEGFYADIVVEDIEDEPVAMRIDAKTILRGVLICAKGVNHAENVCQRTVDVARAIATGDDNWFDEHDAITGDQIIQVGLFGKVIFG
jgi:hypothetical protein